MKISLLPLFIVSLVALATSPSAALALDSPDRPATAPPPQAPGAASQDRQPNAFPEGVVIEEVRKGFAAEQAGLLPGDVILRWSRPARPPANPDAAEGEIRSPFDLADVEMEQGARGPVTLQGRREGSRLSVVISKDLWKITARPTLPPAAVEGYEQGVALLKGRRTQDATNAWRALSSQIGDQVCSTACRCWIETRMGRAWADGGDLAAAREAYGQAARWAENAGRPALVAAVLEGLARAVWDGGEFAAAEKSYRTALEHRRQAGAGSLVEAACLNFMGQLAGIQGDFERAQTAYRGALSLREAQAPDSLWTAVSLIGLGNNSTDPAAAEEFYSRAAAIAENTVPDGPTMSAALTGLGNVAGERGDLAAAGRLWKRSLDIDEKLNPIGVDVMKSYLSLGGLAWARGDIDAAEDLFSRALELAKAMPYARFDYGTALLQLGTVARSRHRLPEAEDFYRRALAEYEAVARQSLGVAEALLNLGEVVAARGNPVSAEDLLRRTLAISEDTAAQGGLSARVLSALGYLAAGRGDWETACGFYARALDIQEKLSPGSTPLAKSLHGMATAMRAQGRQQEAGDLFRRAIDTIEQQRSRLGGSEDIKALFASGYVDLYSDYVQLLVDLRRPREAFDVLERSRARSLLTLMAERDLVIEDEVPPQLERERRSVDAEYERTRTTLDRLSVEKGASEIERLTSRLRELREMQNEISAKIRETSPRLADLRDPRPLDAQGVQANLDPGTAFLAYSVGKEKTLLFVLTAAGAGVRTIPIPLGAAQLRERIDRWRRLAERTVPPAEFFREARALYDLLLRPAEPHIRLARRLLISPDGPLHQLPFAALRRGQSYMAEWKPLSLVPSGTLYAQMTRSRESGAYATDFAAFGDPLAAGLDRLPATRHEVETIARLFPRSAVHLGEQATEERAKAVGKGVRYVHFASHGLIDAHLPLDSALALSGPAAPGEDRDNGRLHAWEIIERVRLDADLVTLSACRSAVGTELAGEGLIGLTRAFHYAGARSVLASLWSVGDKSTFVLMAGVYRFLKSGLSKDEALRRAQTDAIRRGHHPVRWAAFQLYGDWRSSLTQGVSVRAQREAGTQPAVEPAVARRGGPLPRLPARRRRK